MCIARSRSSFDKELSGTVPAGLASEKALSGQLTLCTSSEGSNV